MRIEKEFKELIRPLSNDEFMRLEQSILEEGCRDPIVLWNDTIIDGHNRYEICTNHDIEFKTTQIEFENKTDVKVWIIGNQLGRRNLDKSQRAMIVQDLKPLYEEQALKRKLGGVKVTDEPNLLLKVEEGSETEKVSIYSKGDTHKKLAKIANVGHDMVWKAGKIKEFGDDELIEKVEKGEVSVASAYNQIRGDIKPTVKTQLKSIGKNMLKSKEEEEYEIAAKKFIKCLIDTQENPLAYSNSDVNSPLYELTLEIIEESQAFKSTLERRN